MRFEDLKTIRDDDSPKGKAPDAFNGELYEHQKTTLHVLNEFNKANHKFVKPGPGIAKYTDSDIVVISNGISVDMPVGSGKTSTVISDLINNPAASKRIPVIANNITGTSLDVTDGKNESSLGFNGFRTTIKVFYPKRMTVCAYVCKAMTTVENEIRQRFTGVQVFKIENVMKLREFMELVKSEKIFTYDIILIKSGTVTGSFSVDKISADHDAKLKYMTNCVNEILEKYKKSFSRAVYDDYDTWLCNTEMQKLRAESEIFMSGTVGVGNYRKSDKKYSDVVDMINDRIYSPVTMTNLDKCFLNLFGCHADDEFRRKSMNIPTYDRYRYLIKNASGNIIEMIKVLEGENGEVVNAINGDALNNASSALGLKSATVSDIFSKFLGNSYQKYMNAKYIIEAARIMMDGSILPVHQDHMHSCTKSDLKLIKKFINSPDKKKMYEKVCNDQLPPHINHLCADVSNLLNVIVGENIDDMNTNGAALERTKENLESRSCSICCISLGKFGDGDDDSSSDDMFDSDIFGDISSDSDDVADNGFMIIKCCGIAICADCCGNLVSKHKRDISRTKCPGCINNHFDLRKDIVYIDRNFDIEAIINGFGDEEESYDSEAMEVEDYEEKNPKLRQLGEIFQGVISQDARKIESKIKGIVEGSYHEDNKENIKVLIFASYDETLGLISDFLDRHGIVHRKLSGKDSDIHESVNFIKEYNGVSALLGHSEANCASLNLQFCTDLVIFHRMRDSAKKKQIYGRLQRIGRTSSARFHELIYTSENK